MSKEEPKIKRYKRISQNITEIVSSKKQAQTRGTLTGFKCLEPYISFVKSASTTLFGAAGAGKTQIIVEFMVHAARTKGEVTVLYLTEAGDFAETVLDVCQTYLQKRLEDITDEELMGALAWMDNFFILIDSSQDLLNIREIYEDVLNLQKEYGMKVDNLVIDHYLNLRPCAEQKGMTIAENARFVMQAITRTSKKFNLHTIILFHTRDIDPIKCSHSGKFYLPSPEPWQLTSGMTAFYLSQQMISVWRPISREDQYGVINPTTGLPFELNEMHVRCVKVKPKISGKTGGAVIHFDWSKQAYYELHEGKKCYAGDAYKDNDSATTSAMQPNKDFYRTSRMNDLDHLSEESIF